MDYPALHGNWVDFGILLFLFIYLVSSWRRGFLLGMIDLLGFVFSFVFALKTYYFFGKLLIANFSFPQGIANAIGFLLAGSIAEVLFSFVFLQIFIRKIYQNFKDRWQKDEVRPIFLRFDSLLGFIPVIGEATILLTFLLTLLISLPIAGSIKKDVMNSKLGSPLVSQAQGIERKLNSIFGQAVTETLTFLTINPSPSSSETIQLHFTQENVTVDEAAEQTMLNLVNHERIKIGLRPLSLSFALRDLARDYGKDMFARGYFSHNNPEGETPFVRMEKRGINFGAAGENLALAPNVHLAHQGLMNSPGHRENILSPEFNKVGIGVIDGGIYGQMYVQEFTD